MSSLMDLFNSSPTYIAENTEDDRVVSMSNPLLNGFSRCFLTDWESTLYQSRTTKHAINPLPTRLPDANLFTHVTWQHGNHRVTGRIEHHAISLVMPHYKYTKCLNPLMLCGGWQGACRLDC
jgi:hypothetical protein